MKRSQKQLLAFYKWMQRHSKRLSQKDAFQLMEWCVNNGYTCLMLWKIPSRCYRKWYKRNKKYLKTTITEETTYLVSSNNKAFDCRMGGYSIFAQSIGMLKQQRPNELDRIEEFPCEYAIVVYIQKKQ